MDWGNYAIFCMTWLTLHETFRLEDDNSDCVAPLCMTVGYRDDWKLMDTLRSAKMYLSLCVCIQLLKIIKFMKVLIPKMGLATAVLYTGVMDLFFFGLVFMITLGAFSMMFYVQLGPNMEGYNDQLTAFVSLLRALFGDFDVPDILNNSRGYANISLFILYLFVAVFIMLSMFLAILGESQAAVRTAQDEQRADGVAPPEYGIFFYAYEYYESTRASINQRLWPKRALTNPSTVSRTRGFVADGAEPHPTAGATCHSSEEEDSFNGSRALHFGNGLPPLPALGGDGGGIASNRGANGDGGGGLTARSGAALSIRTEIRELAAEIASISERQRRMSAHIRLLEPRQLTSQLNRLTAAVEALEGGRKSGGGGGSGWAAARTMVGGAPAQSARPTIGAGDRPMGGGGVSTRHAAKAAGGSRSMHMPPMLDVCLGDGGDRRTQSHGSNSGSAIENTENLGHNPAHNPSAPPAGAARSRALLPGLLLGTDDREAPGGSGWARARRHLAHGRIFHEGGEKYGHAVRAAHPPHTQPLTSTL